MTFDPESAAFPLFGFLFPSEPKDYYYLVALTMNSLSDSSLAAEEKGGGYPRHVLGQSLEASGGGLLASVMVLSRGLTSEDSF